MKKIPLTQGKFALVDDKDYERLVAIGKWQCSMGYATKSFAVIKEGKRSCKSIRMHRLIMSCPSNLNIDHIDGNPLNNQKSNLRICTQSQNLMNKGLSKNNSSGFKGVNWSESRKKWRVYIHVDKKRIHLGQFEDRVSAAKAYNLGAIKHYGEFAKLNKV